MEQNNQIARQNSQVQFNFFDADQFAVMQRVCTMFANSELVPDLYKITDKNPKEKAIANCMIAIETAQRIGASPLMVMQNMNIIYGRPSWSAKFLAATVNGCGRFNSLKYKFKTIGSLKGVEYVEYAWDNNAKKKLPQRKTFQEDIENIECIAFTSEKGSDEILESIPVTTEMALKEGWFTKEGSKWKTMPRLMLQYRCVSFWTNAYAPELSMGIKTSEEVIDIEEIPYEDVTGKVADEIKAKANKQPMSMEEEGGNDKQKTESGNKAEENQKQKEENPI
jgi:hypothetical protein